MAQVPRMTRISPSKAALRTRLALAAVVLAPLPWRIWLAATAGVAPDEAYYWTWAWDLAAGYPDHPPAVAWVIRAGIELFGDTALGVRLPALVLGGVLLPLAVYWLGREAGVRRRTALLLPLASLIQPLGVAAGLLITPDVPLLLAWTAGGAALIRAARIDRSWAWIAAGLAFGAALLSKHSAWLILPSAALGIWLEPRARRLIRRPGPWIALGLGLLIAGPNLWRDGMEGFPSLGFQLRHGLEPAQPLRAPLRLVELLAAQIGLLTPLVAWGAWRFLRRRPARPGSGLLWALALVPLAVFGAAALLARPEANWPAPAHPFLLAGAALWLDRALRGRDEAGQRPLRRWAAAAVATSALLTGLAVVHLIRPLPGLPPDREPVARLRAWDDLPEWLVEARGPIVADGYELAAALTFHLPGRPRVIDGRRAREIPAGSLIVTAAPGRTSPPCPPSPSGRGGDSGWEQRAAPLRLQATHDMRRADGAVVRTLMGFRRGPGEAVQGSESPRLRNAPSR